MDIDKMDKLILSYLDGDEIEFKKRVMKLNKKDLIEFLYTVDYNSGRLMIPDLSYILYLLNRK